MNQEKRLPGSKRRWMRLAAIKDLRRLLGGRRRSKSRDDAILPGDVEPCLGLEVVHWVVLEDGGRSPQATARRYRRASCQREYQTERTTGPSARQSGLRNSRECRDLERV